MKTLTHFRNQLARSYGHLSWAQVKNKVRRSELDVSDLVAFCDEANRLYYEHEIERLKGEMEWISVNDRLPEFGEEFNCIQDLFDGDEPVVSITEFDAIKKIFCYPGTDVIQSGITHWMPLPEPPKQ